MYVCCDAILGLNPPAPLACVTFGLQFGGNGVWLHTYVGGIDNAPGSIGFDHVRFAPPVALVTQAAAGGCSGDGQLLAPATAAGTSSAPLKWSSAMRTIVKGHFSLFWRVGCTALSGSISTVLTVLSWICAGIHRRRALSSPVCA